MEQYKCSETAQQKCPDRESCGECTYIGADCDCAKFNEKCLSTKERNIISELREENAVLQKALEMACEDLQDEYGHSDSIIDTAERFIQQAEEASQK